MSGRELASMLETSQSKVSRIESGTAMPTLPQVEEWADAVGASPDKKSSLMELAERAFIEVRDWRSSLRGRPHIQHELRRREAQVRRARTFQPAVVPGLLQTAEYARQVFGLSPFPSVKEEIPAAVGGRMDRQLVLYETERRFEFLITESALRWCPGSDASLLLPAQLDRIASLSSLRNVSIGIIPAGGRALAYASHDFVIHEGQDDVFVTIEAVHAAITVHDPVAIDLYEKTWSALTRMAVFDHEAREIFAALISEFRVSVR